MRDALLPGALRCMGVNSIGLTHIAGIALLHVNSAVLKYILSGYAEVPPIPHLITYAQANPIYGPTQIM